MRRSGCAIRGSFTRGAGAGSFVRELGVREPLGFGQMESLSDLQHCYAFRLTIEPEAAVMAAERRTPEALLVSSVIGASLAVDGRRLRGRSHGALICLKPLSTAIDFVL
jgi:hypothetical protein